MRVEFLLEEPSMASFLEIILPSVLPAHFIVGKNCFLRPHRGKSDLQKSIPNKIRAFSNFYEPAKVIIIHDQDSSDCKLLKDKLRDLCCKNGNCPVLIRIACRELEAWYLGDMAAIQSAYPGFKAGYYKSKAKFRNPDLCNPSEELSKLIPEFEKGTAAKTIPKYMLEPRNTSHSFKQLVKGIQSFLSSDS
jgi:hypothetical protein